MIEGVNDRRGRVNIENSSLNQELNLKLRYISDKMKIINIFFGTTTSLRTDIGRPRLVLVWMKGLGPVEMDVEVPLLPKMVSKINLSKQPFKYRRE